MSKAETREETAKSGSKEVILMALCGMSPGVITETVWALAKEKPSLLVDRVVALTTNKGAECIREELIESGVWKKLRKALNVGKKQLRFGDTPNSIRIMTAQDESRCLDDINTVEASAAAGDFILENIRQISMNPDQRLIFSLAGGRKTMSALSALCMTLLARPEDRLCHVLVQPPYDSPRLQPKFYFPESAAIHLNGDEEVRGDDSDVRLHDIPFVRCRSLFPQKFGDYAGSYSNLVGLVNEKLAPLELQLHSEPLHASMDGRSVSLTESQFILLRYLMSLGYPIDRAQDLADGYNGFLIEKRKKQEKHAINAQPMENPEAEVARKRYGALKKRLAQLTLRPVLNEARGRYSIAPGVLIEVEK